METCSSGGRSWGDHGRLPPGGGGAYEGGGRCDTGAVQRDAARNTCASAGSRSPPSGPGQPREWAEASGLMGRGRRRGEGIPGLCHPGGDSTDALPPCKGRRKESRVADNRAPRNGVPGAHASLPGFRPSRGRGGCSRRRRKPRCRPEPGQRPPGACCRGSDA